MTTSGNQYMCCHLYKNTITSGNKYVPQSKHKNKNTKHGDKQKKAKKNKLIDI